jgi:nicotinamide-nucleotide amidase
MCFTQNAFHNIDIRITHRMKAEIITIGDEILIGQIIDTNSSWLGQQLSAIGISVVHRTSVSDTVEAITDALDAAKKRADIIITTGGLGPTKDDVTKYTFCEYFKTTLVQNEKVLEWVKEIFHSRKLPMLEVNNLQAMVPANCEVLFNRSGTAPGMWFDVDGKIFISMPGVPFEMKTIFEEEAIPKIKQRFILPVIIHRTIQTASIGESFLARRIEHIENALPSHIRLAYLPAVGTVRLRFSGYGTDATALLEEMNTIISPVYDLIGEFIYGEDEDSLSKVVGVLLKGREQTIATAESCTGGYIAHLITSIPGSSTYFQGSIVSYANEVKIRELEVDPTLFEKGGPGAVSETCVTQMAEGIRKKMGTSYAIATSGIAGPDGGSTEKPVGTVWIAISSETQTIAKQFNMGDSRERTILRASLMALDMLRKMIMEEAG